ncbi:unnamed protein product [Rotaria sordida]|uniref:Initiation-specific alpha-1,6-mannosyltransferase n=1 Tax=Rotaria sordida TaxID=392033 RepID=A0A813SC96_9BILA|nr:unnamed protein product [Rotaria sordida]CAF3725295.1 unnamed protein product [Rotaria sordida]
MGRIYSFIILIIFPILFFIISIYYCLYSSPTHYEIIITQYTIPITELNYSNISIPLNIIQTGMDNSDGWRNVQSFRELNPKHSYLFSTDIEAENFVRKHMSSDVIHAYEIMPMTILKADFFRYIATYILGGVYSDIDTECLRAIDTWTDNRTDVGLIVGIEAESSTWKKDSVRPLQLCQWTFAARPNHPILKRMIENILKQTKKFSNKPIDLSVVTNWTGSGLWTDTIFDYLKKTYNVEWSTLTKLQRSRLIGDVYILPITAFQPSAYNMGAKGRNDPEARIWHYFYGGLKREYLKKAKT